jgi:hypothetical protein
MTPDKLGELIHRPPSILAKWRLTGEGPPYIKLGRRVLYDLADVEAWIAAHRRRSTSERAEGTISSNDDMLRARVAIPFEPPTTRPSRRSSERSARSLSLQRER